MGSGLAWLLKLLASMSIFYTQMLVVMVQSLPLNKKLQGT